MVPAALIADTEVTSLENGLMIKLAPLIRRAQDELQADLRAWIKKQGTDARWTPHRYRGALAQMQRAMETIDRIGDVLDDGLKGIAIKAGRFALKDIERSVRANSTRFGEPIEINFGIPAILADGRSLLYRRFEKFSSKYVGEMGDRLQKELIVARLKGETFVETSRRLEKILPGVFSMERRNALRIVRNESMNAYNEYALRGVKELEKEDPGWLSLWDSAHDSRLCADCAAMNGQVIETTDKFAGRWGRIDHPPLHPHCRCCLTAVRKEWKV